MSLFRPASSNRPSADPAPSAQVDCPIVALGGTDALGLRVGEKVPIKGIWYVVQGTDHAGCLVLGPVETTGAAKGKRKAARKGKRR